VDVELRPCFARASHVPLEAELLMASEACEVDR